jgi:hypothetical protein
MNAKQLFEASLGQVESTSIRAWAQSDHNRPLWLKICQESIENNKFDPSAMAAYMVAVAIGL